MKKILLSLFLISFLVGLLLPRGILAQRPDEEYPDEEYLEMPWPAPHNAICCQLKTPWELLNRGVIIGDNRVPPGAMCQSLNYPERIVKIVAHQPPVVWKTICKDNGDPEFGWGVPPRGSLVGCYLRHDVVADGFLWPKDTFVFYEECPQCCVLNAIYNVTDLVFKIALALAVFLILIGAVLFMTSSGDPNRVGLAKKMILYTIIGVGVILLAKVIISVVIKIIAG